MITDIFFDNDGVLVDTEHLFYEVNRQVLQELGLDLSWSEFEDFSLSQGQNVLRVKAATKISDMELVRCIEKRNKLFTAALSMKDLSKPGIKAVVEALAQKFRLTIVTGSMRNDLQIMHAKTGLLQHFHVFVTGEDYKNPKPHPDPYITAMEKLGLIPENCLAIEDSNRGLKSATSARIRTIMFVEKPLGAQRTYETVATCFNPHQIYQAIIKLSSEAEYNRSMDLE